MLTQLWVSLKSDGGIKDHDRQHASVCLRSLFPTLQVGFDPVENVHGATIKSPSGPAGVQLGGR